MIKFRLYPEKKNQYFIVYIWPNKKEFRQHCNWVKLDKRCSGLCTSETHYKKYKNGIIKILPCIGQINLISGKVNVEIASHEISHAVVQWMKRRNIDIYTEGNNNFCSDEEERFCYAQGRMIAQFNHHAHRLKIWTKHE